MAKRTLLKVNGEWKEVKNVWRNVSGEWIPKVVPKLNVSDVWKECIGYGFFYSSETPYDTDTGAIFKRDLQGNVIKSINLSTGRFVFEMVIHVNGSLYTIETNITNSSVQIKHYTKDLDLIATLSCPAGYDEYHIGINKYDILMLSYYTSASRLCRFYNANLSSTILKSYSVGYRYHRIEPDSDGYFYVYANYSDASTERRLYKYWFNQETVNMEQISYVSLGNSSHVVGAMRVVEPYIIIASYSSGDQIIQRRLISDLSVVVYNTTTLQGFSYSLAVDEESLDLFTAGDGGLSTASDLYICKTPISMATYSTVFYASDFSVNDSCEDMVIMNKLLFAGYGYSAGGTQCGIVCVDLETYQKLWVKMRPNFERFKLAIPPGIYANYLLN